jgi:hypothetical protein
MSTRVTTFKSNHRALIILLRVGGVLACTAVIACVMPTTWIVATHRWLGLGDFPDAPITQYLARSLSAFYAMFGGLVLVVSTDVRRYAPVILFVAYVTIGFGMLITAIDMVAGMPTYWTLFEGPPTLLIGIAILLLARRVRRGDEGTS